MQTARGGRVAVWCRAHPLSMMVCEVEVIGRPQEGGNMLGVVELLPSRTLESFLMPVKKREFVGEQVGVAELLVSMPKGSLESDRSLSEVAAMLPFVCAPAMGVCRSLGRP